MDFIQSLENIIYIYCNLIKRLMLLGITFPRQLYAAKFKGRRFYELYQIRLLIYMCDIIIVTIDIH